MKFLRVTNSYGKRPSWICDRERDCWASWLPDFPCNSYLLKSVILSKIVEQAGCLSGGISHAILTFLNLLSRVRLLSKLVAWVVRFPMQILPSWICDREQDCWTSLLPGLQDFPRQIWRGRRWRRGVSHCWKRRRETPGLLPSPKPWTAASLQTPLSTSDLCTGNGNVVKLDTLVTLRGKTKQKRISLCSEVFPTTTTTTTKTTLKDQFDDNNNNNERINSSVLLLK